MPKPSVAVIIGGVTAEHDVSILTGLQIVEAIDSTKYDAQPVYISPDGEWFVGEALRERKSYMLSEATKKSLAQVELVIGKPEGTAGTRPLRLETKKGLFGGAKGFAFDIAFPAIHGTNGEDGTLQGLFDFAGIAYAGPRTLASSVGMSKPLAKRVFAASGAPVLPDLVIDRPQDGLYPGPDELRPLLKGLSFPLCVKPCNLGSSVGVHKADDIDELAAILPRIFRLDTQAMVEPFVPNLVEYNVAISAAFGGARTSAIERPVRGDALLDFKDKYLAAGPIDSKLSGPASEGMASLTREIDPPELGDNMAATIRDHAITAFQAVAGSGTFRADFLCDGESGEVWLNEINTIPGSLAYFLWERADPPVSYTDLLTAIIEEGFRLSRGQGNRLVDAQVADSVIFPRR